MPILSIKALPQKDPTLIEPALKKTCLAIAEFYECSPSQVWATWEELRPGHYVEGSESPSLQPKETHPPIATLTCFEGSTPEQIERLLLLASETLSRELKIEDNIFIMYQEAKSGQVVAGNGVVRK